MSVSDLKVSIILDLSLTMKCRRDNGAARIIGITHFERQSSSGAHSIERLFATIRSALPSTLDVNVTKCPNPAQSVAWLVIGLWSAFRRRSQVNHIVGDIHYVALALPGARTILTVHDLNRLDNLQGLRRLLYKWLYFTLPLRRCGTITTISEQTRMLLVREFPFAERKTQVIYNCLPEGFSPRPKRFNAAKPRILQLGTASNKNLSRVIAAIAGIDCVLHVLGRLSHEQRQSLLSLGVTYESDFDLSDAEVLSAYERADVVMFVSLSEGFGMPIIEAQAIGRAVLTSNRSPMKETAGPGACVIDPMNVAELRIGLKRIIEDGQFRESLVRSGLENVKRFGAPAVAKQYAELYYKLAVSS